MGVAVEIGKVAKERNISLKELSRRADIPYTTIYHAVKRDSKMDFETVQKIADGLDIPWYELYPTDTITSTSPYEQRLASACESLIIEAAAAEHDDGGMWSVDERNKWVQTHLEEIATLHGVKKNDLVLYAPQYVESTEFDFYTNDVQLNECISHIVPELKKMNEDGWHIAIERIQELAQIPKYQRPQNAPQPTSAGPADKDPTEK